jgi:hypothetical protein
VKGGYTRTLITARTHRARTRPLAGDQAVVLSFVHGPIVGGQAGSLRRFRGSVALIALRPSASGQAYDLHCMEIRFEDIPLEKRRRTFSLPWSRPSALSSRRTGRSSC